MRFIEQARVRTPVAPLFNRLASGVEFVNLILFSIRHIHKTQVVNSHVYGLVNLYFEEKTIVLIKSQNPVLVRNIKTMLARRHAHWPIELTGLRSMPIFVESALLVENYHEMLAGVGNIIAIIEESYRMGRF